MGPHLEQGTLAPVLPDWSFSPTPIYALTAAKVYPIKTRLFLDFVQKALKPFGITE